jgi:hypothetical protein
MIRANDHRQHEECNVYGCRSRGDTVTICTDMSISRLCRAHLAELRDATEPYDTYTDTDSNYEQWATVIRDLRAHGHARVADKLDELYGLLVRRC